MLLASCWSYVVGLRWSFVVGLSLELVCCWLAAEAMLLAVKQQFLACLRLPAVLRASLGGGDFSTLAQEPHQQW